LKKKDWKRKKIEKERLEILQKLKLEKEKAEKQKLDKEKSEKENVEKEKILKELSTVSIDTWSKLHVKYWLIQNEIEDDEIDKLKKVDGPTLLMLSKEDMKEMGISVLSSVKIEKMKTKLLNVAKYSMFENIKIDQSKILGTGNFGKVFYGSFTFQNQPTEIAAKCLKKWNFSKGY